MGLGSEVWCVWNLGAWDLRGFKVWLEIRSLGLVGLGFSRFGCENIGILVLIFILNIIGSWL